MKPRSPTIITQRDLAEHLGVSQSTISLAFSDHPRISSKLKERIRKEAEKFHYRIDPRLSALAAYRNKKTAPAYKGTIAWVTNFSTPNGWREIDLFVRFFEGAKEALYQAGYQIEEHWLADRERGPERFREILLSRGIEGLILAPQELSGTSIEMDFKDFAAVSLGFSLANPQFHVIHGELFAGIRTLYSKLRELGHRRIGLLVSEEVDDRTAHHILGAFLACAFLNKTRGEPLVKRIQSFEKEAGDITAWIEKEGIDAILGTDSALIEFLENLGLAVPERISVAIHLLTTSGSVGGMLLDPLRTGEVAAQRLITLLHHWEKGPPVTAEHIAVTQSFHPGETIADRRAAKRESSSRRGGASSR